MSNVLERFRGLSGMEFYTNACNMRREIEYFLMNEKNVPKRHRSNYSYPIINSVNAMIDAVVLANKIYPYTPERVNDKKDLFQQAIDYIDIIYERFQGAMQDMWWQVLHTPPDQPGYKRRLEIEAEIEKIGAMLVVEENTLKGCKEKVKLLKR
jgi:hypothetical protein